MHVAINLSHLTVTSPLAESCAIDLLLCQSTLMGIQVKFQFMCAYRNKVIPRTQKQKDTRNPGKIHKHTSTGPPFPSADKPMHLPSRAPPSSLPRPVHPCASRLASLPSFPAPSTPTRLQSRAPFPSIHSPVHSHAPSISLPSTPTRLVHTHAPSVSLLASFLPSFLPSPAPPTPTHLPSRALSFHPQPFTPMHLPSHSPPFLSQPLHTHVPPVSRPFFLPSTAPSTPNAPSVWLLPSFPNRLAPLAFPCIQLMRRLRLAAFTVSDRFSL